jgi:hypothetical protein
MEHNKAAIRGYIEFEGDTNVTGLTTLSIVLSILNVNLNFGYEFILALRLIVSIYFIFKAIKYVREEESNSYKHLVIFYFLLKTFIICLFGVKEIWTITMVDIILLFDLINYKIFGCLTFPAFIIIPIVHWLFPITAILVSLLYVSSTIYFISKQLSIKIF